jgi:enoyl-[acyl-carrier-protein] reductase (NADH)
MSNQAPGTQTRHHARPARRTRFAGRRNLPMGAACAAPKNHLSDIFDVGRLALFVASGGASALTGKIESIDASQHFMA